MKASKNVFVIMPFSSTETHTAEQWTDIFENVFKPAIESLHFNCERAVPETGSLIGTIVEKLRNSYIVLADISDRNSNVFYELGVRHSLSKRTIIVTQNVDHVPSDLRGYWFLTYGIRPGEVLKFNQEISRLIAFIESNPDRTDNPVSDYLEQENISVSKFVNRENVKKLGALYTEFTGNIIVLQRILSQPGSRTFISTGCIQLLLQTLYLDPGPELLKALYELNNNLNVLRDGIQSKNLVQSTIEDLRNLSEAIFDIRNRLHSDDYKEPETVSLMAWETNFQKTQSQPGGTDISCTIMQRYRELVENEILVDLTNPLNDRNGLLQKCNVCNGSGMCLRCFGSGREGKKETCRKCHGSGNCIECRQVRKR